MEKEQKGGRVQRHLSTLDKIIKYLVKLGGMLVAINAMGTALLMAAGTVAIFASLGDRMMDGILPVEVKPLKQADGRFRLET